MTHLGTKVIQTPRLTLRPFRWEDMLPMFRNWESDPAVTEFLRWPTAKSTDETKQVLGDWISSYSDPAFYLWAIVPGDLGEPIGSISVVERDDTVKKVHIGYCIGSKWWHKGFTSEAFAAIIPFFFEEVGVNRIESQHDPRNPHSGHVMKKCGLTYEGTLRQADHSNQGIVDACMYSILSSEYFARKGKSMPEPAK